MTLTSQTSLPVLPGFRAKGEESSRLVCYTAGDVHVLWHSAIPCVALALELHGFPRWKVQICVISVPARCICGRKAHLEAPTAMSGGGMTAGASCVIVNHFLAWLTQVLPSTHPKNTEGRADLMLSRAAWAPHPVSGIDGTRTFLLPVPKASITHTACTVSQASPTFVSNLNCNVGAETCCRCCSGASPCRFVSS